MKSITEIKKLLDKLEDHTADELEDQDIDFKKWITRSRHDAISQVIEMAICMANGGGGTVVFGGKKAIIGVPLDIDVNKLKKAVYDATDPKLTPIFEFLEVPEGTGRLLVMHVYGGLPPYTDTRGRGKIRIGKDCVPLTGTMRRRIMIETGESDYTAEQLPGRPKELISSRALEELKEIARKERAPEELLTLNDIDFLASLGVIHNKKLTRAGLLLAGKESAIRKYFPGYIWTYLRMKNDIDYDDRLDGFQALPLALSRLIDRIMANNPIQTIKQGLLHFEYRTYSEIAIREALMNAFCHADYRLSGPIMVKHFPNKLEISNPGGFIGGITPDNILHHEPVARNPLLVDALTRLRLVNRANLGIQRMYHSLLIEGKEPPLIEEQGEAVKVTFLAGKFSLPFRTFFEEESKKGRILTVDHLLILQYLLRHPEIDTATVAQICQRKELEAREILSQMEREFDYLERGGTGKGTYWTLRYDLYRKLSLPGHPERDRRIDWEAAKTRVLSVLKQRYEKGLSNAEIRQLTHYDRHQVFRLMKELMKENPEIKLTGKGRYARYVWSLNA